MRDWSLRREYCRCNLVAWVEHGCATHLFLRWVAHPCSTHSTSPPHSSCAVVLPSATSNSLNSGTHIAEIVNPNAPAMTKNGNSGSVDSSLPGFETMMLMTQ